MTLEPLTYRDVLAALPWRNAQKAALRTPGLETEADAKRFWEDVVTSAHSPHRYFAIRHTGELSHVGGITNIRWIERDAELSLIGKGWLDPQNQNDMAAARLLMVYAYQSLNLDRVNVEAYDCGFDAFWSEFAGPYVHEVSNLPGRKWRGGLYSSRWYTIWSA